MLSPSQRLIHIPTGRPLQVTKVDADTITMVTLDDVWPHPKTGKPWGGSLWVVEHCSMYQYKVVGDDDPQMCLW
ncbi:Hypothetical protein DPCES_1373 [Desulfitobacterium hafniense]|uniref:Uncharacterized protein n=1 Tax=Desulfitobacterium hafniense TaxID=49338 RepID=A0A098AYR4_DESHA|nr:hypothetical protein [Desulfitobacterium hafniense]CDX01260.1 Hypothetical protein DPCES_1373 [Desulfitobacterium hafniense]